LNTIIIEVEFIDQKQKKMITHIQSGICHPVHKSIHYSNCTQKVAYPEPVTFAPMSSAADKPITFAPPVLGLRLRKVAKVIGLSAD